MSVFFHVYLLCLTCSIKAHNSMIMDLHAMPTVEVFATGSMGSEIGLWDMNTFRHLKMLRGHTKGVFSLSYRYIYIYMMRVLFLQYNRVQDNFPARLVK